MKLFNMTYVDARIQKQIKQYVDDYNYTYSGMLKSLIYFYEIKHNSIDKANGGVGIIPYIYKRAHDYYYSLWLAQQKNEAKDISEYIPQIKEVEIPVPERKIKKQNLFSFLDEEINNGE